MGPFEALDADFWIPALALAVDQSEPKASPDDFAADGLVAAEEADVPDAKEAVEEMLGLAAELGGWEGLLTATEVK